MIVRTEADRVAAVEVLQTMVADWRTATMPLSEQTRFDAVARAIDDYDAGLAARTSPEPEPAIIEPERPPLAAKFTALREIRSEAERAVAVRDMQELYADWRARSMPHDVQFAFDRLSSAILSYDAELVAARKTEGPSLHESILAQGAAFRMSRMGR